MYEDAYKIVDSIPGTWTLLRDFNEESFMWSDTPWVTNLMQRINTESRCGHSGASLGCVMRSMEFIAENGFAKFMEQMKKPW